MLNVLIIENDFLNSQKIINSLAKLDFIKIRGIYCNILEALHHINKNIHVIIINSNLNDFLSLYNNLKRYKQAFYLLIFNQNLNVSEDLKESLNIKFFTNTDSFINWISDFSCNISHYSYIKDYILAELSKLSFDFSHLGTKYLVDSISLVFFNENYIRNLNKYVYPIISTKYNCSINNIKCNIFQSILQSYCNCDEKYLNTYLNNPFISKPKTKDIIESVLIHIKKRYP